MIEFSLPVFFSVLLTIVTGFAVESFVVVDSKAVVEVAVLVAGV